MRRILIGVVVLVLGAVASMAPAGSGENRNEVTITIRKVVSGTALAGFTVFVTCGEGSDATLNFDANGVPTTSDDPEFQSVGGAWVLNTSQPPFDAPCIATETATGGAPSTSWTCQYDVTTNNGTGSGGCDAANGSDVGPVGFAFGGDPSLLTQDATVTFTNTFVAAVEAAAQLTG